MSTNRLEAALCALTPAIVGYREELPYISPEKIAREAVSRSQKGGALLVVILKIAVLFLNAFSLLTQGKLLKSLDREDKEKLILGCLSSRLLLVRGLVTILKVLLDFHYYAQDEVCMALGFDREALCADADKHQVVVER